MPSKPTLRLIQVGTATLRRDAPFASWIQPVQSEQVARAVRYHTPQPSPVLLADGVDGLSRTTELSSFFRSYAWFVPVRPGDVHPWSVAAYARSIDRVRAALAARSDSFQVTGPTDALTAAVSSSRVAARRLLLLGGETGALLLAFTILAAAALRREVAESRRRLLWAGARRWQVGVADLRRDGRRRADRHRARLVRRRRGRSSRRVAGRLAGLAGDRSLAAHRRRDRDGSGRSRSGSACSST